MPDYVWCDNEDCIYQDEGRCDLHKLAHDEDGCCMGSLREYSQYKKSRPMAETRRVENPYAEENEQLRKENERLRAENKMLLEDTGLLDTAASELTERLSDSELANEKLRNTVEKAEYERRVSDLANKKLMSDNDGLSELVADLIEDWMDNVCPTSFWCKRDGDYVHCEDERCGNLLYKQMARDLGVEL